MDSSLVLVVGPDRRFFCWQLGDRRHVSGKTGTRSCCRLVDRRRDAAGAAGAWCANDGEIPAGLPQPRRPGAEVARRRGHRAAGRRLPAAGLYRGRVCGSRLRCEARIPAGRQAGASGDRRGQSRGGDGAGISDRRRAIAIGGERQGRRTLAAGAGLCFDHPGALSAVPRPACCKIFRKRYWPRWRRPRSMDCWIFRPCSTWDA